MTLVLYECHSALSNPTAGRVFGGISQTFFVFSSGTAAALPFAPEMKKDKNICFVVRIMRSFSENTEKGQNYEAKKEMIYKNGFENRSRGAGRVFFVQGYKMASGSPRQKPRKNGDIPVFSPEIAAAKRIKIQNRVYFIKLCQISSYKKRINTHRPEKAKVL